MGGSHVEGVTLRYIYTHTHFFFFKYVIQFDIDAAFSFFPLFIYLFILGLLSALRN